MRLTLVRHGQTAWNTAGLAQGHTDIELDPDGLRQARLLAERLVRSPIETVLSSDLTRCRQTLAPFLDRRELPVEFSAGLRERSFGQMEGTDYAELHVWMHSEAARLGCPLRMVRPPDGESVRDVWERLSAFEIALRQTPKDTLVLSHGGSLAQLLAQLLRGSEETPRAFRFGNCSVTTLIRRGDGTFLLESFNDSRHLETVHEDPPLAR
ncbi:MAG: histidine phosphatase family protein [Fimbriimonadaceae bacterium]|nr:histidine phosphatase family protein [Fimbriimonadaceae bacterium]QYK58476.1 MAG: histidine phosphatase family protein [Fimbriimonadaceae bacterium]